MYVYTDYDQQLLNERVAQYRNQTERFLDGQLSEDEFLALRLQNGLYVQRHAPMLRVAVPYGTLNSKQVRVLASIAQEYDKGYAHFSTRQNVQFNWPALEQVPDTLEKLASVQMHAIHTSGNCIRNTTTDQFAGVAPDELEDPRPYCEIIRQWSTFHPEFAFLPRKFKIAVTAAEHDRAAIRVHDIGLHMRERDGVVGFEVHVGGGQGRTPIIAAMVNEFVPEAEILDYLEAIMRVYNRFGRRDNKYKARIKILAAKGVVFALAIGLLLTMALKGDLDLAGRLQYLSPALICVFVYLNLMDVEADVTEVLKWEFNHRGIEFAVVGFVCNIVGFYLEFSI